MKKYLSINSEYELNNFLNINQENLSEFDIAVIKYALKEIYQNKNFKEISKELKENEISPIELSLSIISNYNINIDYDDVLVELIKYWVEELNEKNKNNQEYKQYLLKKYGNPYLKKENISNFFIFNEINEEIKSVDVFEIFKDESLYEKVEVREGAVNFINFLKEYQFQKYFILTSSITSSITSKEKQIKKEFNLDNSKIITAKTKSQAGHFEFGIMIDDAIHNHLSIVEENPYCFTYIIDDHHNSELKTDKRIKRVYSLREVRENLPLSAIKNINRKLDMKKSIELSLESIFGEQKQTNQKISKKIFSNYESLLEEKKENIREPKTPKSFNIK